MNKPLVSIICLCYNHEQFVEAAILSTLKQSYSNIEVIVVDDCSTDNSRHVIEKITKKYPQITTLFLDENHGNTRAFNKGLRLASGDYIIDLAADDILLDDRVTRGLQTFDKLDESYGVNFTNAAIIDKDALISGHFYSINSLGKALSSPPEGDLYASLIQRFFICPPTMMSRKVVFESLNGYDESLTYEDFDFWVRSSRKYKYCFTDEVLVHRRKLADSLSSKQYTRNSVQMRSTYQVCQKVKAMNVNTSENKALKKRIYYEMRQCIKVMNIPLLLDYARLLLSI